MCSQKNVLKGKPEYFGVIQVYRPKNVFFQHIHDPTWSQSYQWHRLRQNLLQSCDLLCTLDIRKSPHALFPALILLKPNKHYNHGFPITFDYNHYVYSDFLVCSVLAIAHIICY